MAVPHQEKEKFRQKVTGIIESNLENEQFGVSELARALGMSRSNLHRKIHSSSGKSVSHFIREVRLNKALELLKDSELTVSEVAYRVGFGSATYFSKCFHDQFGYPPGEALNNSLYEGRSGSFLTDRQDQVRNRSRFTRPWFILGTVGLTAVLLYLWIEKPFSLQESSGEMVIMVLPFYNDSPGEGDNYIINGLMDEILNKLALLKELKVISRNTSEFYRNSRKSTRTVATEVGARYILEGSAQTVGNTTRIRLQLIDAQSDTHLWVKPFERDITMENLFQVQEEVAVAIAEELIGVLKPQDKEGIEKKPTENLAAYNAVLKAQSYINMSGDMSEEFHASIVMEARKLLESAISLDPGFAEAYAWIGHLYINKIYFNELWKDTDKAYAVLDSGEQYLDKALDLNPDIPSALAWKGVCLRRKGNEKEAERYHRESTRNLIRDFNFYRSEADWYLGYRKYYDGLSNYIKYLQTKPGDHQVATYMRYWAFQAFSYAGFPNEARNCAREILDSELDSSSYYNRMADMLMWNGDYLESVRYRSLVFERDSTNLWASANIGRCYFLLRDEEEGIRWILPWIKDLEKHGDEFGPSCLAGYAYQKMGNHEMAAYHLNADLSGLLEEMKHPIEDVQTGFMYLHLARVYSMLGNIEKTLEHIAKLSSYQSIDNRMINELKHWPSYDLVRDSPEFGKMLDHLENNYLEEHDRIARMLEVQGLTPG